MSTVISANVYKKRSGLSTKTQGIYFARKYNITTNLRIKNKTARYKDFLLRLKQRIGDEDEKETRDRIIRDMVDPFIIEVDQDPTKTLKIKYEDFLWKQRYSMNGVTHVRKTLAREAINNVFLVKMLKKMNSKPGKFLMIKLEIGTAQETISPSNYEESQNIRKHYENNGVITNQYLVVNGLTLQSLEDPPKEKEMKYSMYVENMKQILSVTVYYINKTNFRDKLAGGFFKYHLNKQLVLNQERVYEGVDDDLEYDKSVEKLSQFLEKYQIFNKDSFENKKSCQNIDKLENCLIHALNLAGIDEKKTGTLKDYTKSSTIAMIRLKDFAIAQDLEIIISTETAKKYTYNDKKNFPKIQLCLIRDHFFINDDCGITSYALKNFDEVKEIPEWWRIYKHQMKKGVKSFVKKPIGEKSGQNALAMVKLMFELDWFDLIPLSDHTLAMNNYKQLDVDNMNLEDANREKNPYEAIVPRGQNGYNEKVYKKAMLISPKLAEDYKKNNKKILYKVWFDFESTTDSKYHKAYMVASNITEGKTELTKMITFIGEDSALKFLDYTHDAIRRILLRKYKIDFADRSDNSKAFYKLMFEVFDFVILAHNITYDIQFLMKHVRKYTPVIRGGNKVCGGVFFYKGLRLGLKDTWAIIDSGLAGFKEFFKMDFEKEIMPYALYNKDTIGKNVCLIQDALDLIKGTNKDEKEVEYQQKKFLKNIEELGLKVGEDHFSHMKYAQFYCERDVNVMRHGYETFREWVLQQLNIDIDDFLTISSISNEYFKKTGCFKDCYYLDGIARHYIQKTVVGGRCMSSENKKFVIEGVKLNDLDGVSLYPSAMKRLGEYGGYLKGTPKVIPKNKLNLKFLQTTDGFFIRIKLKQVRIRRKFPLLSFVNSKGVREFTNDFDETNNIIFMNKISIEDLMTFQGVQEEDFEIIDGYYFDEGRNATIIGPIQNIFDMRCNFKKDENPIEQVYKLVMNTAYGSTCLKESENRLKYADSTEEMHKRVGLDYNQIVEINQLYDCDKYLIKVKKAVDDHRNACHIGSEILAMSKRIMNEVMCLAEDLNIDIYYQDTDSMHIDDGKIELLSNKYFDKYDRELIGKKLGQFHCDFAIHWAKVPTGYVKKPFDKLKDDKYGNKDALIAVAPLYAEKTIILGKKAYMDLVTYKNGDVKAHYRMKGIRSEVVTIKADELFATAFKGKTGEKYMPLYTMYKRMAYKEAVEFDMLSNGKPIFKFGKACVSNTMLFKRIVSFDNDNINLVVITKTDDKEPKVVEIIEEEEYNEDCIEETLEDIFNCIEGI